ncbi:MAG: hypothetical protein NTZ05_08660 [Chloroflexi bacterium]|nr:hypothetical protein [Chloroflexota bacterium]
MGAGYHLNAVLLPEGDRPVDLWIVDGRLTFAPQPDAEELAPAGGFVLPGLADAHVHLTMNFGGFPAADGSRALVDANRSEHLRFGTLLLPPGAVVQEIAALQAAGLAPRDALAAGSTVARRFLGALGLDEGAPADLVVDAKDPRNNPEVLSRPSAIMLGGRRVPSAGRGA